MEEAGTTEGGIFQKELDSQKRCSSCHKHYPRKRGIIPGLLPSSRPLMFHQSLLLAKLTQKPRTREPGKCSPLGYRGILCYLWVGEQCLLLVCVCWFTYDTGVLRWRLSWCVHATGLQQRGKQSHSTCMPVPHGHTSPCVHKACATAYSGATEPPT